MRKSNRVLAFCFLCAGLAGVMLMSACGSSEANKDSLVERNGIKYLANSDTPFTGKSTGHSSAFGNDRQEFFYESGVLVRVVTYWSNGQMKRQTFIREGARNESKSWDKNGNPE
jgi:antitoxin component YwqK of YwqJK toxin-antitoxin module